MTVDVDQIAEIQITWAVVQGARQDKGGEDSGPEAQLGGVWAAGGGRHSAVQDARSAHPRHRCHSGCALPRCFMPALLYILRVPCSPAVHAQQFPASRLFAASCSIHISLEDWLCWLEQDGALVWRRERGSATARGVQGAQSEVAHGERAAGVPRSVARLPDRFWPRLHPVTCVRGPGNSRSESPAWAGPRGCMKRVKTRCCRPGSLQSDNWQDGQSGVHQNKLQLSDFFFIIR